MSGILAFESLKLRNLLYRLDEVSTENLEVLSEVFIQLDDLEASAYYQIARDRLQVIRKLTGLVDENAKERASARASLQASVAVGCVLGTSHTYRKDGATYQ